MTFSYDVYAKARDEKGFIDSKVAALAGVGTSTISAWKNGEYMPKYDKIRQIANVVDLTVDDLIIEEEAVNA